MTDYTGPGPLQRGWYADPSGEPRQRWWDGEQWTDNVHDPASRSYGMASREVLGPDTPVYSNFIWAIVLLPILPLVVVFSLDMPSYLARVIGGVDRGFDPLVTLLQVLNWAIFLGTILLAVADRRLLARDGFERPFHWAWTILASGVYVVGRSIVVRRRAGRGLAPIAVWLFVGTTYLVVIGTKVGDAMPGLLASLPT